MAPRGYSRLQIRLHWAVVGLLAAQYLLHDWIAEAFEIGEETGTYTIDAGVALHMGLGALILLLAFWRLALRQERGVPPLPETDPAWQRLLARLVHVGIYALLLLLPISGAVAWANRSEAAGNAHEVLRALLLLLILAHALGALYGQFVQKTGILTRMMRSEDAA